MAPERQQVPPIEYESLPDDRIYHEAYSNNVFFEPSAWDLKLIFGQLDQRQGRNAIKQHTAITVPWAQVKIFSTWLRGYIEYHEMLNGVITVPANGIPPEVQPPSDEQRTAEPNVDKVYEIFKRLRNELLAAQSK